MRGIGLLCALALCACDEPFFFPAPIATITIAPGDTLLRQGESVQLNATVRDSSGQVRTDRAVVWTSSDPVRVPVSASGLVTAVATAAVTIAAAAEGVSASASVRVLARVVGATIDQGDLTLVPGGVLPLSVTPRDPDGNPLGGRIVEWTSADSAVLAVSATGHSEARSLGATTVTATVEGVRATITVRVERVAFRSVSAGEFRHTCGLATDGRFFCWGENGLGQLGIAAVASSASPLAGAGVPRLTEVTSGGTFTCGVTGGGQAYCWGSAARGRLGNGSFASTAQPGLVPLDGALASLTSGWNHTCGLRPDGAGICWGEAPQVGDDAAPIARTPVAVSGELSYASLAAGEGFTCGLTTDGSPYCWGTNIAYRLGAAGPSASAAPVPVGGGLRFTSLTAAALHACGLTASGVAYCWGNNTTGELALAGTDSSASPIEVGPGSGLAFTAIAAGGHTTCGIATDGAAYCWGSNDEGQLGGPSSAVCGATPCSRTPIPVSGGLRFTQLSAGDHHVCGLAGDALYCWGLNDRGQLGDGTLTNRTAPVRVKGQR